MAYPPPGSGQPYTCTLTDIACRLHPCVVCPLEHERHVRRKSRRSADLRPAHGLDGSSGHHKLPAGNITLLVASKQSYGISKRLKTSIHMTYVYILWLQDGKGTASGVWDSLPPPCSADDAASISSAGSIGRELGCSSAGSAASLQPAQQQKRRGGYKASWRVAEWRAHAGSFGLLGLCDHQ